jgi:hypothetical protein
MRTSGGGICFVTLAWAAAMARRGRFRLVGRCSCCQHRNCCPRVSAFTLRIGPVDDPAEERDEQNHHERSSGHSEPILPGSVKNCCDWHHVAQFDRIFPCSAKPGILAKL